MGYRIDKIHRSADGDVDVVYVIRREGGTPRVAWIAGEETRIAAGENADDLVQRALHCYRAKHPSYRAVAALVVDCSR